MKLDSANRSFLALLGISLLGLWLTVGAGACTLLSILGYEIATGGLDAVGDRGAAIWPTLVFLALVGTGALAGANSLARQLRASRELSQRVREVTAPEPRALTEAARRARLTGRLRMIDSADCFSFAYGVITPRVAISRGLVEAVSAQELDAVLEHERYHVENLDPLKVLLVRALPAALFYVPALRHLRTRYFAGRELSADRRAIETCGRRPLAGALCKAVERPPWTESGAAAAIGGPDLLDIRIAQLERGGAPPSPPLPRLQLAGSVAGPAALGAVFVFAVAGFGGLDAVMRETMPDAGMDTADLVLGLGCLLPWLGAGWLTYRWLARRARLGV